MASDSRSNAGFDQVNTCRKMYRFVTEGERVFVIVTSGSLSISQSIISLLRVDFDAGLGLAVAPSVYHAARIVGDTVRRPYGPWVPTVPCACTPGPPGRGGAATA